MTHKTCKQLGKMGKAPAMKPKSALERFAKPTEIDDATVAFPAGISELMPKMAEIPEEFSRWDSDSPYVQFQNDWFFGRIKKWTLPAKPGIDLKSALRHLKAIQGSWEPKHEHKVAAVAYLLSLWFEEPK